MFNKVESPSETESVTDPNNDLLIDNQATKKVKISEKKPRYKYIYLFIY